MCWSFQFRFGFLEARRTSGITIRILAAFGGSDTKEFRDADAVLPLASLM